ncbi:crotonase/enoyl-CoA hydratase family protein [Hyphomicrobium sp. MC1]|uniref:crotonase/enoyl-CoA hydratase family protein n=1 Tax=Hyphomicrobium sp. (strain MC1) TaxID=717785 RepID=UPI000213F6BF|nr:crotonase/enoyl-CoA hydratase family protein [Hyphomicrobium sp. MC1]CCB66175.1 Enoyl-CoA hydratase/isomerase family protein [Hyphomicrobium sp. MC1]
MTAEIAIWRDGPIQILRIARPEKKNALTGAMYGKLADAIEAGDADDTIAAHILTGSGGVFTAGNDIGDFLATARGTGGLDKNVVRFIRLLPVVKKPLIAAVDGNAIGIGTTLLFHCDLVYAAPDATFATPFLDLGVVPEAASSLLMPARMGYTRAFAMLALGDPLSADDALAAGFVNAIVPASDLEATALAAAKRLSAKPPEALAIARRLMRGDPEIILARMDEEVAAFRERLRSPEAVEAFTAFFEKRPPNFRKTE